MVKKLFLFLSLFFLIKSVEATEFIIDENNVASYEGNALIYYEWKSKENICRRNPYLRNEIVIPNKKNGITKLIIKENLSGVALTSLDYFFPNIKQIKFESINDSLIRLLPNFPKVTKLDVSGNQISSVGAELIVEKFPNLKKLNTSSNPYGYQIIKIIAEKLHYLKKLSIYNCNIRDIDITIIQKNLINLKALNILKTSFGMKALRILQECYLI
jgi:Leucine-rich repeat (LRR) protein